MSKAATDNTSALKESALQAADALRAVLDTNRVDASAWVALGQVLPNGVSAQVGDDHRSARDCFFEALALCRKYKKKSDPSLHVPVETEAEAWLGLGASLTKTMKAEFPNRSSYSQKQCFEKAAALSVTAEARARSSSSSSSSSSSPAGGDSKALGAILSLQMRSWLHLGASMQATGETATVNGREHTGAECLTQASLLKAKAESWAAQREAVEKTIAARRANAAYQPAETVISVAERVARELQKQQKAEAAEKKKQQQQQQKKKKAAAAAMTAGDNSDEDEAEVVVDLDKITRVSAAANEPLNDDDDDDEEEDEEKNARRSSLRSSAHVARTIAQAVAAAIAEEDRQRELEEEERAAKHSKYPVSFWLCLADAISVSSMGDSSAKEMAISALESIDDDEFNSILQNNPSGGNLRLVCFEKAVEASPRDPKLWLALEEALAGEIERQVTAAEENTTTLSLENLNALQQQQQTTNTTTTTTASVASGGGRGKSQANATPRNNNNNKSAADDEQHPEEDDEEEEEEDDDNDRDVHHEVASNSTFAPSTSGITTATDLNPSNNNNNKNNHRLDKMQCHVFGEAFTRKRCVLKAIECDAADPGAWLRLSSLLPMHDPVVVAGVNMPGHQQQQQQHYDGQQYLLDGVTVVTRRTALERSILLSPDHPADAWISLAELLISGGGGGSYKFTLPQDVVRAHNNPGSAPASSSSSGGTRVPLKNSYTALQALERALELDGANVRGWIALSNLLASNQMLQSIPASHFAERVSPHVTAKVGSERNISAQKCVERALSLNYELAWGWQRLALMVAAQQEQDAAEIDKKNTRVAAIVTTDRHMGKISKKALKMSSSALLGEFVSTRSRRRLARLTNQVLHGIRKRMPAVLQQQLRPGDAHGATAAATNNAATVRGKPLSFEQILVRCVETNECAETWGALGQYLAGTGGSCTVSGYFVFDEVTRTHDTKPREVDTAFCWRRVVELDRLSMEGWSYLGASIESDFVEVGGETFTRAEVFEQARLCDLRTAEGLIQMGLDVGDGVVLCGAEFDPRAEEQDPMKHAAWEWDLVGDIVLPKDFLQSDEDKQQQKQQQQQQSSIINGSTTAAAAAGSSPRQADNTFSPTERSHVSHRQLVEKAAAVAAAQQHSTHPNMNNNPRANNNKRKKKKSEILEEQVQFFLRAAALDPLDYRAWAYLGTALLPNRRVIIGENEESYTNVEALLKAVRMQPENGRLWLHLGRVLAFDDIAHVEGAAAKVAAPFITGTDYEYPPRNFLVGKKASKTTSGGGGGAKSTSLFLDRLQVFQVAANLNSGDAETWLRLGTELLPTDIEQRLKDKAAEDGEEEEEEEDELLAPLPVQVEVDGNVYNRRQCFECAAHLDETLALAWTHLYCCLPEKKKGVVAAASTTGGGSSESSSAADDSSSDEDRSSSSSSNSSDEDDEVVAVVAGKRITREKCFHLGLQCEDL